MKELNSIPAGERIPETSPRRSIPFRLILPFALAWLLAASGQPSPFTGGKEETPSTARWLNPDGTPLPFDNERQILDFLREAEVLSLETIPEGINGSRRVLLGKGGLTARAIFRTVEIFSRRGEFEDRRRTLVDGYIYECAAYEISRLIHFDRVPPVVTREINGERGTLQLWLEGAEMEKSLLEEGRPRPDTSDWDLQKQMMMVFDDLVFNTDRHLGNVLVNRGSELWMIDHTRTFRPNTYLQSAKKVTRCERGVWERLQELNERTIKEALQPYLKKNQIQAVDRRRQKLVSHFRELLRKHGEDAVLFDWPSP